MLSSAATHTLLSPNKTQQHLQALQQPHPMELASPCQQGMCFSEASTYNTPASQSTTSSSPATISTNSSPGSKHAAQQQRAAGGSAHNHRHRAAPGTAALLSNSPSISPSTSPELPMLRLNTCQHTTAAGGAASAGKAGSGINSHGLQLFAAAQRQPQAAGSFALPSLHSMLLGPSTGNLGASIPAPAIASTAAAAAGQATSTAAMHGSFGGAVGQQVLLGGNPAPAVAAPVLRAAGSNSSDSASEAQAFLHACGSQGSVAALAVLAHNNMLPVLPVLEDGNAAKAGERSGSQAAAATPLAATVGYMFVLAGRGGVLGPGMGDTTVRTLLWMTEAFFSQYRNGVRTAAYDYLYYDTGLPEDDPLVTDTLADEVPAMIALQRRILVESDFRLLVSEQQLQYACSVLASSGSGAASSTSALAALQQKVNDQVQKYQVWHEANRATMAQGGDGPARKRQKSTEQQQQQDVTMAAAPHQAVKLPTVFPGEVITGMLTVQTGAAAAAATTGRTHQQQQQRALHDVTNAHTTSPQQQQQRKRKQMDSKQNSQQPGPLLQHLSSAKPGADNLKQQLGGQQADSRRAKDQLLQLASREASRQVGGKPWQRQRAGAAAAATVATGAPANSSASGPMAAGAAGQVQQQGLFGGGGASQSQAQQQAAGGVSGLLSGLGVGSRRIARTVMSSLWPAAAGYLGCRPQ